MFNHFFQMSNLVILLNLSRKIKCFIDLEDLGFFSIFLKLYHKIQFFKMFTFSSKYFFLNVSLIAKFELKITPGSRHLSRIQQSFFGTTQVSNRINFWKETLDVSKFYEVHHISDGLYPYVWKLIAIKI